VIFGRIFTKCAQKLQFVSFQSTFCLPLDSWTLISYNRESVLFVALLYILFYVVVIPTFCGTRETCFVKCCLCK